jgi:hypothetical protein
MRASKEHGLRGFLSLFIDTCDSLFICNRQEHSFDNTCVVCKIYTRGGLS